MPPPAGVPSHMPYAPRASSEHRRGRSVSSDPSRIPDKRQLALHMQQQQGAIKSQFSASYAAAVAAAANNMLATSPQQPATTSSAAVGTISLSKAPPVPATTTTTTTATPPSGTESPSAGSLKAPTQRVRGNSVVVRRPVAPPTPTTTTMAPPAASPSHGSHSRKSSITEETGAVPKRSFFFHIFRRGSSSSSSSSAAASPNTSSAASPATMSTTSSSTSLSPEHIIPEYEASNYEIRIRKAEVIVRRLLEEFFVQSNIQGITSPIGFRCTYVSSLDFSTTCNFIVWVEDETIPDNPPSMYVQFLLSHGSCALFNQVCRRACQFFDMA